MLSTYPSACRHCSRHCGRRLTVADVKPHVQGVRGGCVLVFVGRPACLLRSGSGRVGRGPRSASVVGNTGPVPQRGGARSCHADVCASQRHPEERGRRTSPPGAAARCFRRNGLAGASRGVRLSHARLLFFVIVGENQGSGGEPGAPVSTPSSHPACRGPRSPALPGGRAAGSALCFRRVVCPPVSGEPSLFLQPPPWGAAGRANGPPLPHSPHHAGSLALPRGTCDPDCSSLSSVGADGRCRSHTRPRGRALRP